MACAVATLEQDCREASVSPARPYRELSPAAQSQAREFWRKEGWGSGDVDVQDLTEQFQRELSDTYGMERMNVSWSLGYCQGDGVSFEGEPNIEEMAAACAEGQGWHAAACQQLQRLIDAAKVMAFLNNCHEPEWTVRIQYAGRSYGYGNMSINVYCENYWGERNLDQRILDSLAIKAAEAVHDICSDACEVLETQGYAELEYHDSDEYLDELLTVSDHYLFDEGGEFVE